MINMLADFCNTFPTSDRVAVIRAKYCPKQEKDQDRGFKPHSGKRLKHRTKRAAG
jgi:hypothetical protein